MGKYTKPKENNAGQSENSALLALRAYEEKLRSNAGKSALQALSDYENKMRNESVATAAPKQTYSALDGLRAYEEKLRAKEQKEMAQTQIKQPEQPQQKIYYGEDTISRFYDESPNGALYSQMFDYPEEVRNKMADMQIQRLQQKMQTAEKDLAAAEARAQGMVKRSEELATVAGNIEKLRLEYEQTGDEVKMQAYLIASENYNQMVQAYNADLQKLQKDEKVYDTYNQAYVNYERARLMQEQRLAAQAERDEKQRVAKMEQIQKLMDEDPAAGLVLAEADGRQISRTLDKLEDEKSALIRTGEAVDWDAVDAINEKIKGVEALQEQLLRAEANSKGWNSSGVNFVDRTISALGSGIHQGMAGVQAAIDMAMNPVEWLVSSTLVDVANITGNEDVMKEAEAWYQASKEYSDNAKDLSGIAQHYADQATARAGKIDGWILNNLQSVGGMMFDAATMGMAGAAGSAAGVTTGKIMAVRAAGNGMLDAAEKGYSTTEQLLVGVADGALEYVSEKMFGGNPIYDADGGFVTDALAKVIKNPKILRLMYSKGFDIAAEGLEEVFTEFLQPVAEGLITNTDIDWASPADLASAMAGGMFISLMGAGAQVMATEISGAGKAQRQAVKDAGAMIQNADAVQDLILEGLAAKKGTEAYELAVKLQTKMDAGETVSAMEIGRLLMANQEAIEAGYLTEDTKVQPDKKAPKGALTDPEQGFYAIRIRKTEDGRNGYRMVHVKPDGSIDVFGQQTNDLFAAKTAAEIEGYNIRHIGTEQQLYEAAVMEEAEYVKNHTYEEGQIAAEEEAADIGEEERIATEPAAPRNDVQNENTAMEGGIDWAGNDYGKGVETNGRNETVVDRRAQGVETEAQKLGQSGNAARSGGYPAGSEDRRKARKAEAVSRRREEANRVRTYAANHEIPLRSAKDIGLRTGTEIKNLRVLPRGFDKNVDETIDLIESAGLRAVIVSGPVQVEIDGEERYMNGVNHNGVIYVQADSISTSPQQIAKHEIFHSRADADPGLIDRLWDFVRDHYDGAEIRRRYNQYYEAYKDVYTTADPDTLRHMMQEELLADAYAEYERYGDETLPGLTEETWEQAWGGTKNTAADNGKAQTEIKYSFVGKNDDGIEVYETSQKTMDLTWNERKVKYLDVMKNEYFGRTAKFERNGHIYYAVFDQSSLRKPIYGDDRSSIDGVKALIKAGADGDVFDLVENSRYTRSKPNTKDHTDADYFDYFVKTVQIDGKVFDLVADVEKKYWADGGYVYTLALADNKKIKASPARGTPETGPVESAGNAFDDNVTQKMQDVKMRFSLSEDKARQRAEKNIANGIGRIMSMPNSAVKKLQTGVIRELLEEYQQTGEIDADKLSDAVATAFAEGLVANNEFYETYKPVKDYMRSVPVTISEADQSHIADFGQFKKKAFGTMRIVREGGLPVDVMYQEVQEMAPGLLKPTMVHPADQLVQLYEKAKEIRKVEVPLERAMGEQADQFYEWAEGQILKLLEKELTKYADSVQWKKEGTETAVPQDYEWENTYDRASERMYDYGQQSYYELPKPGSGIVQEDYIYPEEGGLEWAGQMQAGNWLRDQERRKDEGKFDQRTVEAEDEEGQFVVGEFVPEPVVEEELTEEERARRGTAREWIQYVMREGVPPEEFAERMRRSAVGELKGGAKILVERMEETARQKRGDRVNLYRDPELTDEEYEKLNAAWKAHQERKANTKPRETVVRKKDFESTPAMDKLGIKIDGSVTRYRATDMLRGYEKAARDAAQMLNKRLKKMNASKDEIMFGKMLADGIMDVNSLNYRTVNIERIAEIADYYMAKKSFDDDRLYQRKAEINQANDQIAKELLTDKETFKPHLSGKLEPFTKMIMNERTPERVVKQIFGVEQGEKIFEFYFRPVWVNGNEMIRFKNRMLRRARGYTDDKDTVGGFADQNGKRRQLTEKEWEVSQRILEGKAVAEEYERLKEDEKSKIAKAARALNDGVSLEEVSKKYELAEGYEQGLAQAYADYLDLNEVADKMDRVIMENAVKAYQKIYNEFYDAYNDFLVSHGFEEIGFIRNYAPHFQKKDVQHGLRAALRSMGVTNDKVTELPTEIAGRTADFKPSKKWNPHSLERKGSKTDYHLLQGFQQYLDYAAEVFYHTDDVMRLRSAVKFLRGQYAAKEISAEIEGAFADMYKPTEWRENRLKDIGVLEPDRIYTEREVNAAYETYTAALLEKVSPESLSKWSEFTTWLENAANVIAGKQSLADRGTEFGGRTLLNAGNKLSSAFAKANVAGNLSSVLNQTAQLPLLQAELGKYLEMAAVDIAKGGADAAFVDHSDFLTEKKGVDVLTTDNMEKIVTGLFKPAQMMDGLVSKLAVRGMFLKALDEGMTDEEAMKAADDFARRVMGSRMKGIRPQGFESKNFWAKMIHVFQLEGANVFDYMLLSDMPQAVQHVAKTKGKKAARRYVAVTAAYYFASAAALNAIVGSISGGSPAPFDIIGWLLTFVAGGWGRGDEEFLKTVIDNGTEKLFGKRVFDTKRLNRERGFDWAGAMEDTWYEVSNDIPFVNNVAGVMGWGDQTMPTVGINEFAEDLWSGVSTMFNQILGGEKKTGLTWAGAIGKSTSDIFNALSQVAPGGRQAKKTIQAARALWLGGRYSGFGKNKKLMYTVDRGITSTAQGLLFGPSAWEETDDYYAGGKMLTAAQTQKVEALRDQGVDMEDTYELYQDFSEINEDLNEERIASIEAKQQKRDLIAAMDLTDEQKLAVYMQTLASGDEKSKKKAEAKYAALLEEGVSWAQITDLENEFASFNEDADGDGERDMDSVDYGIARRNAIAAMDLTDWQRLEVFDRYMLDREGENYESNRAEFEAMLNEGLTWDDVTDAHNTYAMINADDAMNATQKATAYAKWADEQGWTDAQIEAVKERYTFWQMIPAEATSYEKFAGAGLSSDNAAKVVEILSALEPEAGKKSVSDVQRIEAIANGGFDTADAKTAIRSVLSESQTEVFDDLIKAGMTPAQYAKYRRAVYGLEADKDANGKAVSGSKKKKVLDAINKLPISSALKTELYFASGYGESTLDDAPWR